MKTKIKLVMILNLFCLIHMAYGQEITFNYDNAGNLISSKIFIQKCIEVNPSDTIVDEYHTTPTMLMAETENVKVWPNPTRSHLQIKVTQIADAASEYWLYNSQGALIENNRFSESSITLPMAHCGQGVYLLIVRSNETSEQWKILKK